MAIDRIDVVVAARGVHTVVRDLDLLARAEDRVVIGARLMNVALSGIAVIGLSRQLLQAADQFTNYQNRLKLVTKNTAQLGMVTDELFGISNRTRVSFEGTAEAYARTASALKGSGKSTEQLLRFTESLNQAIVLSGATSIESTNALIQLSQGMAAGALRGDELRSVLEQLPGVADVIAKSMGVNRGQLRELGKQGKITGEEIFKAFQKAEKELADKFAKTVPTVSQAFTVLGNSFEYYVGKQNQATGATEALAHAIIYLSQHLDELNKIVAVAGLAGLGKLSVTLSNVLYNAFDKMIGQVTRAKNAYALLQAQEKALIATQMQLAEVSTAQTIANNVIGAKLPGARFQSNLASAAVHDARTAVRATNPGTFARKYAQENVYAAAGEATAAAGQLRFLNAELAAGKVASAKYQQGLKTVSKELEEIGKESTKLQAILGVASFANAGWILAVIAAIGAALIVYRKDIKLTSDGQVTLADSANGLVSRLNEETLVIKRLDQAFSSAAKASVEWADSQTNIDLAKVIRGFERLGETINRVALAVGTLGLSEVAVSAGRSGVVERREQDYIAQKEKERGLAQAAAQEAIEANAKLTASTTEDNTAYLAAVRALNKYKLDALDKELELTQQGRIQLAISQGISNVDEKIQGIREQQAAKGKVISTGQELELAGLRQQILEIVTGNERRLEAIRIGKILLDLNHDLNDEEKKLVSEREEFVQKSEIAREIAKRMGDIEEKFLKIRQNLREQEVGISPELDKQLRTREMMLKMESQHNAEIEYSKKLGEEVSQQLTDQARIEHERRNEFKRNLAEYRRDADSQDRLPTDTVGAGIDDEYVRQIEAARYAWHDLGVEIENVMGPSGTLTSGVANNLAKFITFQSSVKDLAKAMTQLAQTVVQEVVAAFIRAAIAKAFFSGAMQTSSSTTTIVAGAANMAPVKFASGGYTGDGPTDSVAGVVHGKEGVLNAGAMKRLGKSNLALMNSGGTPNMGGSQVHVYNMAPGVKVESRPGPTKGEILLMIKEHAPDAVSRDMDNESGKTYGTLRRKFDVRPRRP